jgi:SAM-dependent methyltransferase
VKSTDWTAYYSGKKHFIQNITQSITLKQIVRILGKYAPQMPNIIELGGGNSCFADDIINHCQVKSYSVIDNNELAVQQLKGRNSKIQSYLLDLLSETELPNETFDFVFSVGLIEHFDKHWTAKVVKKHLDLCKQNGIVLLIFPTPTKQYSFARKFMEIFGVWQFHDERPLEQDEVFESMGNSILLEVVINRKLPLTQMIMVWRKI